MEQKQRVLILIEHTSIAREAQLVSETVEILKLVDEMLFLIFESLFGNLQQVWSHQTWSKWSDKQI